MYIIIAGCGKIGANLVKTLSNDGHDVVVIDPNEENFAQLENGTNCLTITGMPIDEDVLKSAGIERADALCASSGARRSPSSLRMSSIRSRFFSVWSSFRSASSLRTR